MKGRQIRYSDGELAFIQSVSTWPRGEALAAFSQRFRRDDVSLQNFNALCKRKGWLTGRTGCFAKGEVPHNKGVPCEPGRGGRHPNARKTQFKRGRVPHNTNHLGHERIDPKDGYVYLSVAEQNPHTGFERRYVLKHKWLWEKANGPLPDGMALKCLDGVRHNTDPSNWEAVPRAILPRLAGGNRYNRTLAFDDAAPEIKPAVLAIAKLRYLSRSRLRDSDEHRDGEDPKGLSGEAMPARAEGIAHPLAPPRTPPMTNETEAPASVGREVLADAADAIQAAVEQLYADGNSRLGHRLKRVREALANLTPEAPVSGDVGRVGSLSTAREMLALEYDQMGLSSEAKRLRVHLGCELSAEKAALTVIGRLAYLEEYAGLAGLPSALASIPASDKGKAGQIADAVAEALARYSVAYSHATLVDMSTANRSWKVHETGHGNPFDHNIWLGEFDNKQDANDLAVRLRREAAIEAVLTLASDAQPPAIAEGMPRIYLAARFSRRPECNQLGHALKARGAIITSRWTKPDCDHVLPTGLSRQAEDHERQRFALEDVEDVRAANWTISLMEEPRSNTRGGRHIEFGYALALDHRLTIIGQRETVFHHLPQVEHFDTVETFLASLPNQFASPSTEGK